MCASLNAAANAEPRCPDVPNETRCEVIDGSGASAKYAVTNRGTLTSNDRGTGLPARGLMRSDMPLSLRSQNDLHTVCDAVVRQRDEALIASHQCFVINRDREDAATDATRVLHHDLIACGAIAKDDLETRPATRDTRIEHQIGALQLKSQKPFQRHSVHPSG